MATGGDIDIEDITHPNENISDSIIVASLQQNEIIDLDQDKSDSHEWHFPGKKLTLVLIGKTGVGKSTLTNAFLGKTINVRAIVSEGPNPGEFSEHQPYNEHTGTVDGLDIVMYDTKGFGQGDKRNDEKILKKLKEVISESINGEYIIVICQRLKERANNSFNTMIELLAKQFGKTDAIWKRCILGLTMVNMYGLTDEDADKKEDELKKGIEELMANWSIEFQKRLIHQGVPEEIINNIPVCPIGNRICQELPVVANWIYELLDKCESQVYDAFTSDVKQQKLMTGSIRLKKESLQYGEEGGGYLGRMIGSKINCSKIGYRIGSFIGKMLGEIYYKQTIKALENKK